MLKLEIITPEGTIYSGEADSISLPTPDGEITILPHHIPLMSVVAPGTVTVRGKGVEQLFAVSRGVVEMEGAAIRILADTADRAEELQEAAIERAQTEAKKLLSERRHDNEGFAEATAVLDRELAKLQTLRRHRSRKTPHIEQ